MTITTTLTELLAALEQQKITPDEFRELIGLTSKTAFQTMKTIERE